MTDAQSARLILAQYEGLCLSCEEEYAKGDEVNWEKGVGCWHKDCPPPRGLKQEKRWRDERVRLGLDASEFGSAPQLRERAQ